MISDQILYTLAINKTAYKMRERNLPGCGNCNCISTPFKQLTPDELSYLNRNRVELRYKRGENLCKQETTASHIIYLRSGLIKIFSEEDRANLVLSIETKGHYLGLQTLHKPHKYNFSAKACEETTACLLDINAFSEVLNKNAAFATGMMKLVNDETRRSYERLATLGIKQLHGRLSDLLLCLSVRIYKSRKFSTSLNRKDLAQITNMSPESLSRVLKDMKEDDIINVKGNNFEIKDIESLRKWSRIG